MLRTVLSLLHEKHRRRRKFPSAAAFLSFHASPATPEPSASSLSAGPAHQLTVFHVQHQRAAGGQISGKSLDQVAQELAQAIDQYLEE